MNFKGFSSEIRNKLKQEYKGRVVRVSSLKENNANLLNQYSFIVYFERDFLVVQVSIEKEKSWNGSQLIQIEKAYFNITNNKKAVSNSKVIFEYKNTLESYKEILENSNEFFSLKRNK